MLIKFLSLLMLSTTVTLAQIHTNPGGGGLVTHTKEDFCNTLDKLTAHSEKKFVTGHKHKYSSQKDFFKILEKMHVKETIATLDQPKKLSRVEHLECDSEDIGLLKTILESYQMGGNVGHNCKQFEKRLENYELLKKVIEINDKK